MKFLKLTIFSLFIFLFHSCYTYKVFPKEFRKMENFNSSLSACVINNSLEKEFNILKVSNIFRIVKDSAEADLLIKLYPLKTVRAKNGYTFFGWKTGADLSVGLLTLGQFPMFYDDIYLFQFDEIKNNNIVKKSFELHVTTRLWFWDIFNFNKRFEDKASKALLGNYFTYK